MRRRAAAAQASGHLHRIESESHFIEDGGVRFIVRCAADLAPQLAAALAKPTAADPFMVPEPELFVADLTPTHYALLNKYNVDELYDALFVNRAKDAGIGLWRFDARVVDGVVNGSASATVGSAIGSGWWDRWIVDGLVRFIGGFIKTVSWPIRLIQTGYFQNYALVMILGVLIFIGYVLWGHP